MATRDQIYKVSTVLLSAQILEEVRRSRRTSFSVRRRLRRLRLSINSRAVRANHRRRLGSPRPGIAEERDLRTISQGVAQPGAMGVSRHPRNRPPPTQAGVVLEQAGAGMTLLYRPH